MMAWLAFWMVGAHFIGDYALQSDWVAKNKCVSWYVMVAHCAIWTVCICAALAYCNRLEAWMPLVLFLGHTTIDEGKCKGWYGLAYDQTLHFLQLLFVWLGCL